MNVPGYTSNAFLNDKSTSIHFLALINDEEMHSPLSKQSTWENLDYMNVHFSDSILTNYVKFYRKANFNCDSYLIIAL